MNWDDYIHYACSSISNDMQTLYYPQVLNHQYHFYNEGFPLSNSLPQQSSSDSNLNRKRSCLNITPITNTQKKVMIFMSS